MWTGVVLGAVVLVLLLVFMLHNTRSVRISYFTAAGVLPVGVLVLRSAVAGVLLAGAAGSLRIRQRRHRWPTPRGTTSRQRGRPAE